MDALPFFARELRWSDGHVGIHAARIPACALAGNLPGRSQLLPQRTGTCRIPARLSPEGRLTVRGAAAFVP